MFVKLPQLRAVYACWDAEHVEWLRSNDSTTLTEELLHSANVRGSIANEVFEETLKGKEFALPPGYTWFDKDGHARDRNRLRWWKPAGSSTYHEMLFSCPPALQAELVPAEEETGSSQD